MRKYVQNFLPTISIIIKKNHAAGADHSHSGKYYKHKCFVVIKSTSLPYFETYIDTTLRHYLFIENYVMKYNTLYVCSGKG
jgi:hypothetical protein